MLPEFHRDLATGAVPTSESQLLDARELLWRCEDGNISGLTLETITQNCTAFATISRRTGKGADAVGGFLHWSMVDVVPSAKNFSALHVIWTGETFNAFDHVSHIAAGFLSAYLAAKRRLPTSIERPTHKPTLFGANIGPTVVCGMVIRDGSDLLVRVTGEPGMVFGDTDGPDHSCWRPDEVTGNSTWRRLVNGNLSQSGLTTAAARQHGLTVDPIATQTTHEVGFCFGVVTIGDEWAGDLESSYAATWEFDSISIYREYFLNCVAAFVDKQTLHASCPEHEGTSNCEPDELRGTTTELSLTTLPEWDESLHSYAIQSQHAAGYAYIGSQTVSPNYGGSDVTVTYYYTPCAVLSISFADGSGGIAWVTIRHDNEYTADDCDGYGDNSTGQVTSPTVAGYSRREFYHRCYTGGPLQTVDGVRWYGTDCIDHPNQTQPTQVHGIVGQCDGTDAGQSLPVCVQGLSPNQLPQLTDCWSLDPIAIGYRRRVTNVTSTNSAYSPDCDYGGDLNVFAPDGQYRLMKYCGVTHLLEMGFSANLEYVAPNPIAFHFYVDITE